ncbi:acyltransferase family protein [Micromonospora radicis]|uniref:Acyltransferase n=1 Tax=Micromonospora radicis TaxID=1894971 RepID=A0A418MNL1_9ACTN|nr:acyltransferase [Micromonospora radicis]
MGCRVAVSTPSRINTMDGQPDRNNRHSRWLPALEGLRAVAVVMILVHHVSYLSGMTNSPGQSSGLLARLDVGVALLFALSGFLLYRPFAAAAIHSYPTPSVRRYLWHRALRILPGYWAMAAVALAWLNIQYLTSPADWAIPLLLMQVYEPLRLPVGMEHTWSLATGAAFCLLLPLVALLGRCLGGRSPRARARRQLALGIGVILVGLLWNGYVHTPDSPLQDVAALWLPSHLDWFGTGVVLAVLVSWPDGTRPSAFLGTIDPTAVKATDGGDQLWYLLPRGLRTFTFAPATSWAVAAVLLWIASTPIAGPRALEPATRAEVLAEHLLFLLVAWCLIAPLVGPRTDGLPRRFLGQPAVRFLGRISYGIFLWHLLVLEAALRLLGFTRFDSSFWSLLAVTLALTIPIATASHYLVERPVRLLYRRVESRSLTRPPEPASAPDGAAQPATESAGPPLLVPPRHPPATQHQGRDGDEEQHGRHQHE